MLSVLSLVDKFVPGTMDEDLDSIIQEWHDFQVATDLPEFVEVDDWWGRVLQLKDCMGQIRFGHLAVLIKTLLILPYDQAPVELLFSLCTKNDTKFRSSLGAETLCNLLHVKVNTDCDCHMLRPTKDLLDRARHATGIHNNHRPAA